MKIQFGREQAQPARRARANNWPGRWLWLRGFLLWGLALVPLVILVHEVGHYAVDIPFWDQWNFVPLLGRAFAGELNLSDLWQQHIEHRPVFPRLLMIGLARLSGYNIFFELGANIVIATAILILIISQFLRIAKTLERGFFPWTIPIFSLLIYSLNQGENWLWGWQLQIFLNILAVVAGCLSFAETGQRSTWLKLGSAMGAGGIAAYSFANGLLFWPLGLVALLIQPWRGQKQKWMAVMAWFAGMASVFLSYFYQFRFTSPSGQPWFYFLSHPAEYVCYVLQYLGAAVINYEKYALIFGLVGLLFFITMSAALWRQGKNFFRPLLPFFLLGLYAIGCAGLTGIGRVSFGPVQAMSYRYVTFSSLLWMANFVYLFLLLQRVRKKTPKPLVRVVGQGAVLVFIFLLLVGIGRTSYRVGHRVFVSHHHRLAPVRLEFEGNPVPRDELLLRVYVDADYVREGLKILKKHELSVFRKGAPEGHRLKARQIKRNQSDQRKVVLDRYFLGENVDLSPKKRPLACLIYLFY